MPNGLVDFPGIAVFRPGYWNEEEYGRDFPAKLAKSFAYFAQLDPKTKVPFYIPYVSVNHDQYPTLAGFQFGNLENVRVDKSGLLTLDANEVPGDIGELVKRKMLRKPSLEFATPIRDASGKIIGGMRGPDGEIYDGPVIKCLTFLGSEIPGVQGLPDIPDPVPTRKLAAERVLKFAQFPLKLSRFGERSMDRASMIAALQAANVDCSTLTDAIPDEFLAAVLAAVQATNTNPVPEGGERTDMAAATGATGAANAVAGTVAGGAGAAGAGAAVPAGGVTVPGLGALPNNPAQVLLKFNQQFPGLLPNLTGIVGNLQTAAAAINRTQADIVDGHKETCIQAFFDRTNGPGGSGQVTEAELPGLRRLLMKLDHGVVRSFADKTLKNSSNARRAAGQGTELEEFIADIERSRTPLRKFGHKTPQAPVTRDGGNAGAGMSPDRRARILKGAGYVEKK